MARTYGRISEFDSSKEDWKVYEERLSYFFEANEITEATKKRAIFLSSVGASTYALLRSLVAPSKPGEKSFAELITALSNHFQPAPSPIVERFKFHSRSRKPGESVADFVAELRRLSEHCKFENTLNDMIRDRLVCGINDDALQKRLLAEPDLTYEKAVKLAKSHETATQNVEDLKTQPPQTVGRLDNPRSDVTCYRCGRKGHIATKCHVDKDVVCHGCRRKGHLKRACTKGRKSQRPRIKSLHKEKEGLACIFSVKKFHNFLFGHPFEMITDHKPLLGLLRGDKALPAQASARIKRWSLFLSNYEYQLCFRDTKSHANADALSRLPLPDQSFKSSPPPELVLLSQQLENFPVSADQIQTWTRRDVRLSKVLQYVQYGWPKQVEPDLAVFSSKRLELSAYDGCLLWGNRVVVPCQGHEAILQELHSGHPGICRMRSLARMYVWWPGIDSVIEKTVRSCTECQAVQAAPPLAPLNPWKWPARPWARLHIDFAGPFQGKTFLVIIDAHSKWIEAMSVGSTSSAAAILELRTLFSRYGIPETLVSDNGTGFTSGEFENFLATNGVKRLKSAPYHPATNGLAERAVQIVKRGLKKVTAGSVEERLARVLFAYRITPQSTTGLAPDELLLGRKLRTRLDLLRPNSPQRVESKQLQQKQDHDFKARPREFIVGDLVSVRNFGQGDKWLPGVVIERTGPVSCCVAMDNGVVRRCHQDQLRSRLAASTSGPVGSATTEESPLPSSDLTVDVGDSEVPGPTPRTSTTQTSTPSVRVYPSRVRNPPERFEPSF